MVYGWQHVLVQFAVMDCTCVHCEWNRENAGRSFTEFYQAAVRDNIHHAKKNRFCDETPPNWAFLEQDVMRPFLEFIPNTNHPTGGEWVEWSPDDIADHYDKLQAAEEREREGKGANAPLVYPSRQNSRKRADGYHWTKVYEHRVQTGWRPAHLTQYAPPVNAGQRESVRLSQKSRRRLLDSAFALGRHCPAAVFVTLTYKTSVCQSEAKAHVERFLKRVRYWAGYDTYLWVAELQRRGVIHFHLLIEGRLDKNWIQDTWRSIIQQEVYTHVGGLGKAYTYLAKYVSKVHDPGEEIEPEDKIWEPIVGRRWGVSRNVTQWRKPLYQVTKPSTFDEWDEATRHYSEHYEWMRSNDPGQILKGHDNLSLHDRYTEKT